MSKPPVNPAIIKKFEDIERTYISNPTAIPKIFELDEQKTNHELLPGVTPLTLEEIRARGYEQPEYAIDQLILKSGINAISGVPESHKSYLVTDIVKCMSLGTPFLNTFPTQKCKTLIVDEENSPGRVEMRFATLTDEKLDVLILCGEHIKIDEPGVAQAVIEYCNDHEAKTVVLDSLSSMHSADENSNPQMAKVFENLLRIKQAGITVIFLHHEPKSSGGDPKKASLRGAGDILAKCDTHISLRHPTDDVNTVIVKQWKNRDSERLPEFSVAVHREEDHTWFEYIGEAPKQVGMAQRTDDAIIELLTADGELYQGQIFDALKALGGVGGQKKITERLDALTPSQLTCDVRGHGRKYYAIKQELEDE